MVTLAIGGTQRMTREEADKRCSQYQALYSNIDADLARWKHEGISLKLMQRTMAMHTTLRGGQKGFAAGFHNGKV